MRFSTGEEMLAQGRVGGDMYIIREGMCAVVRRVNLAHRVRNGAPDGPQEALQKSAYIVLLGPGDLVGHGEALSGKPALFAVAAHTSVEAWRVSIDQLTNALRSGSEKMVGRVRKKSDWYIDIIIAY